MCVMQCVARIPLRKLRLVIIVNIIINNIIIIIIIIMYAVGIDHITIEQDNRR